MGVLRVGVVGAGVVGLNTALELQKEFPTADFTIVADKFNQDTTSDGAAGQFNPANSFAGPDLETTRMWIKDSYKFYDSLRQTENVDETGIFLQNGFFLSNDHPSAVRNHYLEGVVPVYRSATREEMDIYPGNWKYGAFYKTLLIECRKFQPWAMSRFERAGGKVVKNVVSNLQNLADSFDVVVNCSGLAAKYLCDDWKMVPIRGQIIKVKAPWIKTSVCTDDMYVIPGINTITLGGCWHYDSYDLRVSEVDKKIIKDKCEAMEPSLKRAEFIRDWVGLRPHRDPVRVEGEALQVAGGRPLQVVHNYGHGGYGVTASPGTAKHAVRLVRQCLAASRGSSFSKL